MQRGDMAWKHPSTQTQPLPIPSVAFAPIPTSPLIVDVAAIHHPQLRLASKGTYAPLSSLLGTDNYPAVRYCCSVKCT